MKTTVSLAGIIAGYQDGPRRNLDMRGPYTDAATWLATMEAALRESDGSYNNFSVARVGAVLARLEKADDSLRFAPARENSPAVYIAGDPDAIAKAWPKVQRALKGDADEITREGQTIRLWWD